MAATYFYRRSNKVITEMKKRKAIRRGISRRRRNDASQPYRFGSRSVPRRPSPFDFAELVSPHPHTLKGKPPHPYIESCNRFSLLVYDPRSLCDPALAPILAGPGTLFGSFRRGTVGLPSLHVLCFVHSSTRCPPRLEFLPAALRVRKPESEET